MNPLVAFVLVWLISSAISWVTLMIVISLLARVSGLGMPEMPGYLWKVAVLAASTQGVIYLIALSGLCLWPLIAFVAAIFVAWLVMKHWFDATLWHVIAIGFVNAALQRLLLIMLATMM